MRIILTAIAVLFGGTAAQAVTIVPVDAARSAFADFLVPNVIDPSITEFGFDCPSCSGPDELLDGRRSLTIRLLGDGFAGPVEIAQATVPNLGTVGSSSGIVIQTLAIPAGIDTLRVTAEFVDDPFAVETFFLTIFDDRSGASLPDAEFALRAPARSTAGAEIPLPAAAPLLAGGLAAAWAGLRRRRPAGAA